MISIKNITFLNFNIYLKLLLPKRIISLNIFWCKNKDYSSERGHGHLKKIHKINYPELKAAHRVWINNQWACIGPTYTFYIYVTVV